MKTDYTIRLLRFDEAPDKLAAVRESVFVKEQHVPIELEWDGLDAGAVHALAETSQGEAIATGRLLADGHIGRMAVLLPWRGQGIGRGILQTLMQAAQQRHLPRVFLSAQTHAIDFYRKQGFRLSSEEYLDAGIPHRDMVFEFDGP